MTFVIDVGCASWGGDVSIPHLIEEFQPKTIYGFDPGGRDIAHVIGETTVIESTAAVWTYDGTIGFVVAGLGGHVDGAARASFACVDLARFIHDLGSIDLVLKLDCEGAEYTLLPHLRAHDADLSIRLAVVEWHCETCGIGGNGRHRENCTADKEAWLQRRADTEALMRCELAEWGH